MFCFQLQKAKHNYKYLQTEVSLIFCSLLQREGWNDVVRLFANYIHILSSAKLASEDRKQLTVSQSLLVLPIREITG